MKNRVTGILGRHFAENDNIVAVNASVAAVESGLDLSHELKSGLAEFKDRDSPLHRIQDMNISMRPDGHAHRKAEFAWPVPIPPHDVAEPSVRGEP